MYEAILFDMDGTLVDTVDIHVEAWAKAMRDLGRPVSSEEIKQYKSSVGKTLKDILADIYGREEAERIYPDVRRLKNMYFISMIGKVKPIILPEVLRELSRRYYIGVVSSSTREAVKAIMEKLGYAPYRSVIISGEDISRGKPDPEGILKALDTLDVEKALYVGDTKYDEEAARRAGVDYMYVEEFLGSWRSLL